MRIRKSAHILLFLAVLAFFCAPFVGAQPSSVLSPGSFPACSTNPTAPTTLTAQSCCWIDTGKIYCGDSGGTAVIVGSTATVAQEADCEADGDTALGQLCVQTTDGSIWGGDGTEVNKIGPTATPTLQQVYDAGSKTISGVDSLANAIVFTDDGTNSVSRYIKSGQPTDETDCNGVPCPHIISRNGGADKITITNSGDVTLEGNLKEAFSEIVIAKDLDVDGTQCLAPAADTIAGVPFTTVQCAANDAGAVYFAMQSPTRWDAGTLSIEATIVNENATPANDYDIDWSAQCVGLGEAITNTWGSEVAMDFDFDASGTCGGSACDQNDAVMLTVGPITPSGTCTKGDLLVVRGAIDQAGTTTATPVTDVHILGIRLIWTANDWSD